jgi:excisionase family DNA binding protein
MEYNLEKPLFTLTIGEYINLNKQLNFQQEISQIQFQPIPSIKETNDILIDEASKMTGLAISTIRTKCHFNEIPYHKPKGTKLLRFKRDELMEWMASNKSKTSSEVESDINSYLTSIRKKK